VQQAIIYKESNIAVYIFMQVVYNNLNKVGPKTVPCGTPESTDNLEDVTTKDNKTLGFLRRNMKNCTCTYTSLLRPVVDYSSPVWNPSKKQ
jgi:hypothetical protein